MLTADTQVGLCVMQPESKAVQLITKAVDSWTHFRRGILLPGFIAVKDSR